jgi:hypothetical protein
MPEPIDPKEFEAKLNACVPWLEAALFVAAVTAMVLLAQLG